MDTMMEDQQLHLSLDGARNTSERSLYPLYSQDSTLEGHGLSHHYQIDDINIVKVEIKEEKEENDELCMGKEIIPEITKIPGDPSVSESDVETEEVVSGIKKEDNIPLSCTDGEVDENSVEKHLSVYPGVSAAKDVTTSSSGGNLIIPNLCLVVYSVNLPPTPSPKDGRLPIPPLANHKVRVIKPPKPTKEPVELPCEECGKCFPTPFRLKEHKKIHMGIKPHFCSECGKYFSKRSHLVRHQMTHTGEKPYSCSECGKDFATKHQFNTHLFVHTGERPYSCSECGKTFSYRADLIRHDKVHTGERPYSCSECGKGFLLRSTLLNHERIHTREKPYSCSKCTECFTSRNGLQSHQSVHRKDK